MSRHEHVHATPIVPVGDLDRARGFYETLGFGFDPFDDRYAIVTLHGHEVLHVAVTSGLDPTANHSAVYLNVEDVDAWHRRWSETGGAVGDLADRPWGMREFQIQDPWGTTIRVGTNL